MAGILDSKKRVIDGVVTQEGKRQISMGGLRPVFATVADKYSYYEKDAVSGSSDATKRIYFESPIESINDSIVMETDDSGKLLGYPVRGREFYRMDGVVEGVDSVSGTLTFASMDTVTGFASLATSIVTQSLYRFKNLMSIGTRDSNEPLSLQTRLNKYSHTFTVDNNSPFNEGKIKAITDLDYLEPLFWDERLSNVVNFKFLPPVTEKLTKREKINLDRTGDIPTSKRFGIYTKVGRPFRLTYEQIMSHLLTPISNDVTAVGGPLTYIPEVHAVVTDAIGELTDSLETVIDLGTTDEEDGEWLPGQADGCMLHLFERDDANLRFFDDNLLQNTSGSFFKVKLTQFGFTLHELSSGSMVLSKLISTL